VLFEETTKTLFCGDLFTHMWERPALTTDDIVGPRSPRRRSSRRPLSSRTAPTIRKLAALEPERWR